MVAFLTALALFLVTFGAHLLLWRARVPRNQMRTLVMVFTLTPLLIGCGLLWTGASIGRTLTLSDWIGIGFFHLGAMGCYLITYTGIEEDSPSLTIVRAMERSGSHGCTREELARQITEERFLQPRIRALVRGGFLEEIAAGKRLTARGRQVARSAVRLSRLFNIHDSV